MSPDGTRIAFSFNQGIWLANVDGSGARREIVGDTRLRHPAWSPDGRPIIAYLATRGELVVDWVTGVFATNYETDDHFVVDLGRHGAFHTVRGPLSWYR